jgi:hydroxymethylbilane synthase
MATRLPDGLAIAALLEREDVRDAFLSPHYATLADLPPGARLGTSSLRRQALARRARPDLEVVGFRGNVDTRLAKLEAGVADATFLAAAGLNRLGAAHRITCLVDVETMPPAPAQGAIAIETRADDWATRALVAPLDHQPTALCITAERAFLARLDGSCRMPIAGLARLDGDHLRLDGMLLLPDGSEAHSVSRSGPAAAAISIGDTAAEELIARAGPEFMRKLG